MELTDDMLSWIDQHAGDDTSRLRLKYSGDQTARFCILQIEGRRSAARKLPHTLEYRRFQFPTALSAEQCTSDEIAEFHASLVSSGERVLDMTAGLGIDSFHIARRGARVTAIDINPEVAEALGHNAAALGLNVENICADSTEYLRSTDTVFDTIFIDPARRGEGGKRLFALSDCTPDVTALLPLLRERCRRLIVKTSPMLDIDRTLRDIPCTTQLYVTGTRHECKELVAVCDFTQDAISEFPTITAMTAVGDGKWMEMSFTQDEERRSEATTSDPQEGQIVYEPYPAVMKSGAYRLLCARYGCAKLHPNTHLYVSDTLIEEFPGTAYRIESVIPFSSKELKQIHRLIPSGSVGVRNFVMTAEELSRKLKLKEDATRRVIGTTSVSGRVLLVIRPQ